jgi:hypothetical protein
MIEPVKKYPATIALVIFLSVFMLYRVTFYSYPDQRHLRNPLDLVLDVFGFSYHFVMLGLDIGQGASAPNYHAREALRYKPGDTYILRFVPDGGAKQ